MSAPRRPSEWPAVTPEQIVEAAKLKLEPLAANVRHWQGACKVAGLKGWELSYARAEREAAEKALVAAVREYPRAHHAALMALAEELVDPDKPGPALVEEGAKPLLRRLAADVQRWRAICESGELTGELTGAALDLARYERQEAENALVRLIRRQPEAHWPAHQRYAEQLVAGPPIEARSMAESVQLWEPCTRCGAEPVNGNGLCQACAGRGAK